MPEASNDEGDPELQALFERFRGHLISPGGAAALLGVSRQTVHTLEKRGHLRIFRSSQPDGRIIKTGPKWAYVPLIDLRRYAERVGRPFPKLPIEEDDDLQ